MDLRKVCASLVVLFLFAFGSTKGSYAEDVRDLFNKLFTKADHWCKEEALSKMQGTSDKDWAKALVNLYTQECFDYNGTDGKQFYNQLNRLLRDGDIEPGSVMETSAKLLNDGMDIIGLKTFYAQSLYRGCNCKHAQTLTDGMPFEFFQFASTTKLPHKAFNNSFYFVIENAIGVEVEDISAVKSEKEVLLKSTAKFTALEVITNTTAVKQRLREVGAPYHVATTFIVLDQKSARKRRSVNAAAISCDCSRHGVINNGGILRAYAFTFITTLTMQWLVVGELDYLQLKDTFI